jgi:hypothetical protein
MGGEYMAQNFTVRFTVRFTVGEMISDSDDFFKRVVSPS